MMERTTNKMHYDGPAQLQEPNQLFAEDTVLYFHVTPVWTHDDSPDFIISDWDEKADQSSLDLLGLWSFSL